MAVLICCDRCRRVEPVYVNELPDGWLQPAPAWPGSERDVCPNCVTVGEQRALAELVEVER